mgnify:CR=1 FL=1
MMVIYMSNPQFRGMSDEQVETYLIEECDFIKVRKLESGEWIGILKLMFTTSVCMDIDYMTPYVYRWCFENKEEAEFFFENAKEYDEVPVKRESLKGHRYNRDEPLLVEYDEHGFKKW